MGLNVEYFDGQTHLDEEEKEGLRILSIATRQELDEFEQQNIEQAIQWSLGRPLKSQTIFSDDFIRMLHKRMFGEVWTWAGTFRKTKKNIGIDPWQIPQSLKCLLDDTIYWHENHIFPPDEIALRFKHRLVSIHCFPNGNGRHSRLMADIVIEKIFKLPVFSWGTSHYSGISDARTAYLKALKAADLGDYRLLLGFARE